MQSNFESAQRQAVASIRHVTAQIQDTDNAKILVIIQSCCRHRDPRQRHYALEMLLPFYTKFQNLQPLVRCIIERIDEAILVRSKALYGLRTCSKSTNFKTGD